MTTVEQISEIRRVLQPVADGNGTGASSARIMLALCELMDEQQAQIAELRADLKLAQAIRTVDADRDQVIAGLHAENERLRQQLQTSDGALADAVDRLACTHSRDELVEVIRAGKWRER